MHPDKFATLEKLATLDDVPFLRLGTVGGGSFKFGKILNVPLVDIADAWRNGLEHLLWK